MSAARNMVRALRDSGTLAAPLPEVERHRILTMSIIAAAFGAMAYVGGMFALPQLPNLMRSIQPPAPTVHFVKPN
jgi:hypothetical protein